MGSTPLWQHITLTALFAQDVDLDAWLAVVVVAVACASSFCGTPWDYASSAATRQDLLAFSVANSYWVGQNLVLAFLPSWLD